jgi:hypothetical protein
MKTNAEPYAQHTFLNVYAGDFNGDGKDDILVHSGNAIHIYRSNGSQLDVVFSAVERVSGSWQFTPATASSSATSTATARTRSLSSTARTG